MPKLPDKLYQVYRTETVTFLVFAGQASEAAVLVQDGQRSAENPRVLRQRVDVSYHTEVVRLWHGSEEVQ